MVSSRVRKWRRQDGGMIADGAGVDGEGILSYGCRVSVNSQIHNILTISSLTPIIFRALARAEASTHDYSSSRKQHDK
jgi:hypothetical protein